MLLPLLAITALSGMLIFTENAAIVETLLIFLAGVGAGGAGGYGLGRTTGS